MEELLMKKALAILITCMSISLTMAGCGNKNNATEDTDAQNVTSGSDESSSSSEAAVNDPKELIGEWLDESSQIGYVYNEDNTFMTSMYYSDYMYFNSEQELCGDGIDNYPSEYDGSTLSVTVEEDGETKELMTLVRVDGENSEDSIDGMYALTSGMLYDEFDAKFGTDDDYTYVEIDGENLWLYIPCGDYTADETSITLYSELLFTDGYAEMNYEIDGDTLILNGDGGALELKRVD
jgi:hypothetical protein